MVYFFIKGPAYLRCELQLGPPHVLTIVEPSGATHTEVYHTSTTATDRWSELQHQFAGEGWSGPFGRDPRF